MLAQALGWSFAFALALIVSTLLHLDSPPLRAALSAAVNQAFSGVYRGRIELSGVDRVGAFGAAARELRVIDEHGETVLSLTGIRLEYGPLDVLRALRGAADAPVTLEHVRVEEARLSMTPDPATGEWTLLRALSKPPKAGPTKPGKSMPMPYELETLELGRLELSLNHPSVGEVHARVDRLRGAAKVRGPESEVSVERFGIRLVAPGDWTLEGTGSLRLLPKGYLAGTFHGFVDGLEIDAAGHVDDGVLMARLDIPHASPERLRSRLPGWPLAVPLAVRVRAEGPPELLRIEAKLRADPGEVDVSGTASLSPTPRVKLALHARELDARAFAPALPTTRLEARGALEVTRGERGLQLTLDAESDPAQIADIAVPALKAALRAGEDQPVQLDLAWQDHRGRVDAHLEHSRASGLVLSARASDLNLSAIPRVPPVLRGRGDLTALARLSEGRFSVDLRGDVRQVSVASVALGLTRGHLTANVNGRLDALSDTTLDARLSGEALTVGGLAFDEATWTSSGTWRRTSFQVRVVRADGGAGTAQGVLDVDPEVVFSRLEATWSAPDVTLRASARRWSPARGELEVDALSVSGAVGSLQGSASVAPERFRAKLDADALDVGALARALRVGSPRASGRVTGHAELEAGKGDSRAGVDLRVDDFGVLDVALGELEVDAQLEGRHLEARVASGQTALGRFELAAHGDLGGSVLDPTAWARMTGAGSVKLGGLPLWPLGVAAASRTPVRDLDGRLEAVLQLERSDPSELPDVFLEAATPELAFAVDIDPESSAGLTRQDGLRLHASASVAGRTGMGSVTLRVTDQHGDLLTTTGMMELDLRAMLRDPGSTLQRLLEAPLDALVRLHPRSVSLLPPPFTTRDLTGSLEASLLLRGSLSDPRLELTARGHQLVAGVSTDVAGAVDVSSRLEYTPSSGELSGVADIVQSGKRLVTGRLAGRMDNPLESPDAWRDLELHAAAMLNGVPLELLPQAARNEVTARVYGSLSLEREGRKVVQRAQLELAEVSIAGHPIGNGRLTFDKRDENVRAELRLGPRQRDLRVQVRGSAGPSEVAPGAFEGTLSARQFDAASLTPLVQGILSRLSGAMNADLKFTLRPEAGGEWYLGIDGDAALESGGAQLDLFGLELRDLAGRVRARSTPEYTVIQIEPVTATARSRRPNFSGDAELWLRGFRVVSGEANLRLDEVPLTIAGASRLTARGTLRSRLERQPDHMSLQIKIPDLRLRLPSSTGRTLIALDPNPELNVLQAPDKPERAPRDPLLWKLGFELGDNVRVQRSDLEIPIYGSPRLEYSTELRPAGTIETAPGGHITLFDQRFSIDRGIVEFVPDEPSNPRVEVTASWQAPDGTTVYVDITGRAKQASISTRDDRGLEDVERFYLLTGSMVPDDGTGSDPGAAEGAVLGQTVALGINEVLRDTLGNVAVSVGTRDDRASYGASVRLTDKLTFEGSFQPGSESNFEESTNDLTGTLDYRFSRSWSLRTELGTSGAAFDLLWSHRY